jgi:hypothetical protein
MLSQAPLAFGQQPGMYIGGNTRNGVQVYPNTPGTFDLNHTQQDITSSMNQIQSQLNVTQGIDRAYLDDLRNRLNNHLAKLTDLVYGNQDKVGLQSLANQQATRLINLTEYLPIVNDINKENQLLMNEVGTLTVMTKESLPSYANIEVGTLKSTSVSSGNVLTGPLVKAVETARAQLIATASNIRFTKLISNMNQTVPTPVNALQPDLTNIQVLNQAQREEYQKQINENNQLSAETKDIHNRSVDATVNLVNQFVNTYGNQEWLRWDNSNDAKAIKEAFADITDAFFRRSYTRKKYHYRIGAIQADEYPKEIGNLEEFGLKLQPLKVATHALKREAAIKPLDVKAAFENARNFVELFDKKSSYVLASRQEQMQRDSKQDDYASQDTGVFVRANALITKATDQLQTAQILLNVMRMVLADAREEMFMLHSAFDDMEEFHNIRYATGADMQKDYLRHICQFDFTLSDAFHEKNCVPEPIGISRKAQPVKLNGDPESVAEISSVLLQRYSNIERNRSQLVANAQRILDADSMAGMSDADRKQQQQDEDNLTNFGGKKN